MLVLGKEVLDDILFMVTWCEFNTCQEIHPLKFIFLYDSISCYGS